MAKQENYPLPNGYQLFDYKIEKKISSGGFSLVYLGYDKNENPVAIKEFMPASMNLRAGPNQIELKAESRDADIYFKKSLNAFFKEAELLSKVDDRSVVKILNFFMYNNTAYMVMPYEYGQTLQKAIHYNKDVLSEQFIQQIFVDLMRGICFFHQNNLLHLDMKPSNIHIRPDNTALILDLGTSILLDDWHNPSPPMHTPGFAAPEQHKQFFKKEHLGPWTDLYNIGATIYACITKRAPPIATDRIQLDEIIVLHKAYAGLYSDRLLKLIDSMLILDYKKRTKTTEEVLDILSNYVPPVRADYYKEWYEGIILKTLD